MEQLNLIQETPELKRLQVNRQHLEATLNALPMQAFDSATGEQMSLGTGSALDLIESGLIDKAISAGINPDSLNKQIVFALQGVMNTGKGRGSITEIPVTDLPTLASMAFNEYRGESQMNTTVMRTVFGGSKQYPLRSLSYLVPSLRYAQGLHEAGIQAPHVQFVTMPHVGARVNGGETAKMAYQSDVLHYVGDRFVQTFFPEIADKVQFVDDSRFIESPLVNAFHEYLQTRLGTLSEEELQERFSRVDGNTLKYATYHPLVHDVAYAELLFAEPIYPDVIINVGGQAEKQFHEFRMSTKPMLEEAAYACDMALPQTVQFFTDHKVPPYMPLRDRGAEHDIPLSAALANPGIIQEHFLEETRANKKYFNLLCRDVGSITSATGSLEEFVDFMDRCR